ncbi:hypothetical protein F5884DRAFT_886739 [Xylogone sp. PMI_703]|nr:hypothetical protein F5884DRAFT_886739 [Xylogone sp. PMI_703]
MSVASPRVLVTGGGLGIGCATVDFLLNQYNARVIVFTLELGTELEALSQRYSGEKRLWIHKGDVTKVEDTEIAVAIANTELGGLDALVVSAGIESPPRRILDLPYSEFHRTIDINVCGAFLSVQKSLPALLAPSVPRSSASPGKIIILSSTADKAHYAGRSAYCTSKAALTRLIDNIAWELRDSNIDVYGVYPGFTKTKLADGLIEGRYDDILFPEEAQRYHDWVNKGAVEGPEWCADAIARLSVGKAEGQKGTTASYSVHVPELKLGFW